MHSFLAMVTARASPLLLSHWTWLSSLPLPISFSTSKVLALTPIYLSSLLINQLITPALSISPIPGISCISCDLAYLAFEKTPAADLPLPSSLSWLLNIYRCINPTLNIWCLSLVKLPTTTCFIDFPVSLNKSNITPGWHWTFAHSLTKWQTTLIEWITYPLPPWEHSFLYICSVDWVHLLAFSYPLR